jgi:murein L,D-transpeptidase YcbB/YkuD
MTGFPFVNSSSRMSSHENTAFCTFQGSSMPRAWRLLTAVAAFLTLSALVSCSARNEPVRQEIASAIRRRDMPDDAPWRDRRTQALVRAFYTKRHMEPAWTTGKGALDQARDLADVVGLAADEGLNPDDYSAAELAEHWKENKTPLIGSKDPKELAEFDLLCTIAAFHYMSDVYDGRISPKALDAEWVAQPRRGDFDSLLTAALRRNRVRQSLTELAPTQPDYQRLRSARRQYAERVANGDVAARQPLALIDLNMERWRWVPRSFGDRYLLVNIPEYALHVVERGRSVIDMRVVVGKALTATPVFSDRMTHVVINPTWNVPTSIVQGEYAAKVEQDPSFLARQRIRIYDGESQDAREIDASSVDWYDSSEVSRLRLQQDPGQENALGRIKFMLPNRFDVYLHDTPSGHLFAAEERSFSHGCVRVEDPLRLARYVLRGSPDDAPGKIESLIARESTVTLEIPKPLPVHIVYFTAYVENNGTVKFRDDVYGIDQDLIEKLHNRSVARERQEKHGA